MVCHPNNTEKPELFTNSGSDCLTIFNNGESFDQTPTIFYPYFCLHFTGQNRYSKFIPKSEITHKQTCVLSATYKQLVTLGCLPVILIIEAFRGNDYFITSGYKSG